MNDEIERAKALIETVSRSQSLNPSDRQLIVKALAAYVDQFYGRPVVTQKVTGSAFSMLGNQLR